MLYFVWSFFQTDFIFIMALLSRSFYFFFPCFWTLPPGSWIIVYFGDPLEILFSSTVCELLYTHLFYSSLVSVSSNALCKRQVHLVFYGTCRTSYFRKFWASPELCISCLDLLCNSFLLLQLQHLLVLGKTSKVAAADVIFSRPILVFLAPKWPFSSEVW